MNRLETSNVSARFQKSEPRIIFGKNLFSKVEYYLYYLHMSYISTLHFCFCLSDSRYSYKMHSEKRPQIHGGTRMALVAFIDKNYSHAKCPSNGKSIEITNGKKTKRELYFCTKHLLIRSIRPRSAISKKKPL